MTFTPMDPVALLIHHFPALKTRIEEDDLLTSPHIAYSLLATEVLENTTNKDVVDSVAQFINDLANSGDSLLEELLILDILEGIAQNAEITNVLRKRINGKARAFLEQIEREFFKRGNPGRTW